MIKSLAAIFRPVLQQENGDARIDNFEGFVRVETGLRLLEVLDLTSEPPLTIWALLQGHELPAIKDHLKSPKQRRWMANYRSIVHQSSAKDWQSDLEQYADIPDELRLYQIILTENPGEDRFCRTGRQEFRATVYDEEMERVLKHRLTKKNPVKANSPYLYRISDGQYGRVVFPSDVLQAVKAHPMPDFPTRKTNRPPIHYSVPQLKDIARELDNIETQHGWPDPGGNWTGRIERMLRFHPVNTDGSLGDVNTGDICIDHLTHIPGMVGSGKTTVATLIAVDFCLRAKGHILLIAPDVPDVLRQVNYFNRLLPTKSDQQVAVPLVGFSERNTHLHKLFNNEQFDVFEADGTLRYLDTTCLVMNWLSDVDATRKMKHVTPGRYEPCEKLLDAEELQKHTIQSQDGDNFEFRSKHYQCPLFAICPMHQVYRDLFQAPIWVTTVGALAQARVPVHVDPRNITLWTLVYEHTDLIIFDEIDASQAWFDGLFAPELPLDDSSTGGLLQTALRKLGDHPSGSWRRSSDADRWRQSFDQTIPLTRNMLGMIEGDETIRRWLTRVPYSPVRLIEDLAQRLSYRYLWYEDDDAVPSEIDLLYDEIHAALVAVSQADSGNDSAKPPDLVQKLVAHASSVTLQGRSQISRATRKVTLDIIQTLRDRTASLEPVIEERFKKRSYFNYLRSQGIRLKKTREEDMEPLGEKRMANRLEFALVAIALDNALRGVFYGWTAVEDLLGDEFFPSFIPRTLLGIVPVPPTGHWRGFRTMPSQSASFGNSLTLSTFEYAGVGRQVLANFPNLLNDLDGLPGPHVLAMSGTSHLPHSSRFHFSHPPVGVLEPPENVQMAIRESRIAFTPQSGEDKRLVRISGAGDQMDKNLASMITALSSVPTPKDSILVTELERLVRLGEKLPDHWADRSRIILMVNSYDQAEKVMQHLRVTLPAPYNSKVFSLGRSGDVDDNWLRQQRILRSEVESRGPDARILVAPMGALGRGYNLISPVTKNAAFGSIYFLIRPMTPPHDAQEMVSGINSYLDGLMANKTSTIWQLGSVYEQMRAVQRAARREWNDLENQQQYRSMLPERKLGLGANTASLIIQSCGRLVRGGVPFNAYFVDASWVSPEEDDDGGEFIAKPSHSLLAAAVQVLNELASTPLGKPLYGAFAQALTNTIGVRFEFDGK